MKLIARPSTLGLGLGQKKLEQSRLRVRSTAERYEYFCACASRYESASTSTDTRAHTRTRTFAQFAPFLLQLASYNGWMASHPCLRLLSLHASFDLYLSLSLSQPKKCLWGERTQAYVLDPI